MIAALAPGVAQAGAQGRKNSAIALSGAALYTWLNGGTKRAGRRNTAIVLTAASVSAWHKYKKAKRAERRRSRAARYYAASYARPVSYVRGYRSSRGYGRSYAAPVASRSRSAPRSHAVYCEDSYGPGVRAAS
jgi:hypothetical protein